MLYTSRPYHELVPFIFFLNLTTVCTIPTIFIFETFKFPNNALRAVLYSWIAGGLDPCSILALWLKLQFLRTAFSCSENYCTY